MKYFSMIANAKKNNNCKRENAMCASYFCGGLVLGIRGSDVSRAGDAQRAIEVLERVHVEVAVLQGRAPALLGGCRHLLPVLVRPAC